MSTLSGVIFSTGAIVPLIALAVLILFARRRQARGDAPLSAHENGDEIPIAVRALYSRGAFGAASRNSMNPRFAICPDRLRYRIFKASEWPFAEIAQVDVRKGVFGGVYLLFLAPRNSRLLSASVNGMDAAKAVLARLPPNLPLSEEAALLRDGDAGAATPGLPRYHGPIY